jgi:hypothetical protein
MCCPHGARRQAPIVALAGAIYGAYQTRKEKRASASSQDIGIEGGKYVVVPQQSHADAVDGQAAPPDYEDVIRNDGGGLKDGDGLKDEEFGEYDDREEEDPFLAPGEDGEKREGVKMGFFERLHAKKEEKRLEREERREAWRAERRSWVESRAERRAEWRAARGRRGCCRQAC